MKTDAFIVPVVECRADESRAGPGRLTGVILELGRVAADRQEVFTPGSAIFPSTGVELLRGHRGEAVMSFDPVVNGSEIRIDARLPDTQLGRQVATEVRSGERSALSIEFIALDESRVQGVRELRSALIQGAALVPLGSYNQARAEVRHRAGRRFRRSWQ